MMKGLLSVLSVIMISGVFIQEASAQKIIRDEVKDGVRVVDYLPSSAVCSKVINLKIKDGVILQASYTGGCQGNTRGISALISGMDVDEAISRLDGIQCGRKGTSCPDQLANCLKMLKQKDEEMEKREDSK